MKDRILPYLIAVIMGLFYLVGFSMGRDSVPTPDPTRETIVIPTCSELDSYGYDGLATCINDKGDPVTPGSN